MDINGIKNLELNDFNPDCKWEDRKIESIFIIQPF